MESVFIVYRLNDEKDDAIILNVFIDEVEAIQQKEYYERFGDTGIKIKEKFFD